jgi:hypothetical protein
MAHREIFPLVAFLDGLEALQLAAPGRRHLRVVNAR